MSTKREDCILIFMPFNKDNGMLVKELVKSGKKVRVVTENLKQGRNLFYDFIEKLEGLYELPGDNFSENMKEITKIKNGVAPNIVLILSHNNSNESQAGINTIKSKTFPNFNKINPMDKSQSQFESSVNIINFFKSKENYKLKIKKFILVNVDNCEQIVHNNKYGGIEPIYNYYTEKLIRDSKLNYLIVRINDIMPMTVNTFTKLLERVIEGKAYKKDSTIDLGEIGKMPNFKNNFFKVFGLTPFLLDYYLYTNQSVLNMLKTQKIQNNEPPVVSNNFTRAGSEVKIAKTFLAAGIILKVTSFMFKKVFLF